MPDSDDAYEAAMRAADALFARPNPGVAAPASPEPTSEASSRQRDGAEPASTPQAAAESAETIRPPERGGRILPVIDEAPPPQFAALEAEYAPKRRGRKPGSKNKPKIDPLKTDDTDARLRTIGSQAFDTTSFGAPAEPATRREGIGLDRDARGEPAFGDVAPAMQVLDAIPADGAPRGPRRLAKARDQLKPGEGWKRRRLPRICW